MRRREFLGLSGVALGTSAFAPTAALADASKPVAMIAPGDWTALRKLFPLTRDYIQLSTFLLASHPKPVADEIERHRRGFDNNPSDYWHHHFETIDTDISNAAANYMGGKGDQIALTDSTTMGLGLVYSGLKLSPGDEILQSTHDHYSTDLSLALRAQRTGATVRRMSLYDDPAAASVKDIIERLKENVTSKTKAVAVTWVHSSTGVKLPIREMANALNLINRKRGKRRRIVFCVDGVHGFGIENQDISELGCDFFIAGTHKWIFGPRGTGLVWGSDYGWEQSVAVIPSFSVSNVVWLGLTTQDKVPVGQHMSPGGFHSFEHRWALPAAFELHMQLGKANVQRRIHQLNTLTKESLDDMEHVRLHTPMSSELSSGLVCFDVKGMQPDAVVKHMHEKGIIMSSTPYRESHARFATSLLNNEQEMGRALSEIRALS